MIEEVWGLRALAVLLVVMLALWRRRALRAEAILPAVERDSFLIVDIPGVGESADTVAESLGLAIGDLWRVAEMKVVPTQAPDCWLVDLELKRLEGQRSVPCEKVPPSLASHLSLGR